MRKDGWLSQGEISKDAPEPYHRVQMEASVARLRLA